MANSMAPVSLTQDLASVSTEAIRRILQSAQRSPSGDNCQPWRFEWDGEWLRIHYDFERGRHSLNLDENASYLALGCLLESIRLAASREGLQPDFSLRLDLKTTLWAECRFVVSHDPLDPLCEMIERRETDRRRFAGGVLNDEVLSAIRKRAAERKVTIRFQADPPVEFVDFLAECEELLWTQRNYQQDILKWIRFSDRKARLTRDGMPWRGLGISFIESRLLACCRSFAFQQMGNRTGFLNMSKRMLRRQIASSAALGCVAIPSRGAEDLVRAGEAGFLAWLTLNQAGYGFQPLSLTALFVFLAAQGKLPESLPARFRRLFDSGVTLFRTCFDLIDSDTPVWMFRTGISRPISQRAKTYRRDVDEVLTIR